MSNYEYTGILIFFGVGFSFGATLIAYFQTNGNFLAPLYEKQVSLEFAFTSILIAAAFGILGISFYKFLEWIST